MLPFLLFQWLSTLHAVRPDGRLLYLTLRAGDQQRCATDVALLPEEGLLATRRAVDVQWQPAVRAQRVILLHRVPASGALERPERGLFTAVRADVRVRRDELAAVRAWVFISRHSDFSIRYYYLIA